MAEEKGRFHTLLENKVGLIGFLYGGDPEWRMRRWFMFMSLAAVWLFMVGSAVSAALGRMPVDLAQTIITSGFALIAVVVPGYLFSATWDTTNKRSTAPTIKKTKTLGADGKSETVTETTLRPPAAPPVVAADPALQPPKGFAT